MAVAVAIALLLLEHELKFVPLSRFDETGASDKERKSDRGFIEAGGSRMTYTVIPFASHSLKSLVIAGVR